MCHLDRRRQVDRSTMLEVRQVGYGTRMNDLRTRRTHLLVYPLLASRRVPAIGDLRVGSGSVDATKPRII